jgi:hypothetical protein
MKAQKKETSSISLANEQIVQKKLDEANEMLRRTDLSQLRQRLTSKQENV